MTKCPLCGGHVLYLGAVDLECDGPLCPNESKSLPRSEDIVERIQAELAQMYGWFPIGP